MSTWIRRFSAGELARLRGSASVGGPLAGTTFGVKDNIDVENVATTAACRALERNIAARHAPAVARLLAAGAVPVGKTNLDQFATGLVGTRTPYGVPPSVASRNHVSGGSSSGSAVAVAAGEVPFALGTDTAGSGRVPAAFNGIVGVKPTRGLVPVTGVMPACLGLDCVTTFTRTVAGARPVLAALAGFDSADPWSRPGPAGLPARVAAVMRVIGVPAQPLELDGPSARAWRQAVRHAAGVAAEVVEVDVRAFLAAAGLMYAGPWLAQRWSALRAHLGYADPVVAEVVRPGERVSGAEVFAGLEHLARLARATEAVWARIDALLLPVTPTHPELSAVAADPVGVNAALGRYTTFVNLLDLCAVAVPAGQRPDGLPFGVQLIAPAFADQPLLDLAARWNAEPAAPPPPRPGSSLLAVAGPHLPGQPAHMVLAALGGTLRCRARTTPGCRLYALPGPGAAGPRPGLARTGDGPAGGIAVEVWELPHQGVAGLLPALTAPLALGHLTLADGTGVTGLLAEPAGVSGAADISRFGGWCEYLASGPSCPGGRAAPPTPG